MDSGKKRYAIISVLKIVMTSMAVVIILILFKDPLTRLIDRAQDVTVDTKLITIAIKTGVGLSKAEENRSGEKLSESEVGEIAAATKRINIGQLSQKTVLWVDDNPDNNRYESSVFENLGIDVMTATSGAEALEIIDRLRVDIIISDFKRSEDPRYSGYGLLHELQKRELEIPYVIYSSGTTPEYRIDAKEQGAVDQTNRATELFSAVMASIIGGE